MTFQYEKNLPHQEEAIAVVIDALVDAEISTPEIANGIDINNQVLEKNLMDIQVDNQVFDVPLSGSRVIDISMETGTGKTYTYAKTMYELHRQYGLFKFIVVVPTLSIKAGTENFLKSKALAQHFRLDFEGQYADTEIELYVVQSKKNNKKSAQMTEVVRFTETTDRKKIHVLLINSGMINSDSMAGKIFDGSQLIADKYTKPYEALAATRPVVIIDEPHKFDKANTTWRNIEKFNPLLWLRYGATFTAYENLVYRLTAIDAFNDNLVKGVNVFVEELVGDDGSLVRLISCKKEEAVFELFIPNSTKTKKETFKLRMGDCLGQIHPAMTKLYLEKASTSEVLLSNGLSLKKNETLNPYSYDDSITNNMLRSAIKVHFDTERELLTREEGRIKPLTLFFIDDIKGYREGREDSNSLLNRFERFVQAEIKKRLQVETDDFYKNYLQKALDDISATHGGYFAQDNSEKDSKIEQEMYEILHDKESLISLDNPRRFIFSKWTLREGWDNPNVFGICKLRSSGSDISKLQEVGRGLRLPVNEYMARVKDSNFYLNYFVDSREKDFAERLINEINSQIPTQKIPKELDDELINKILKAYPNKNKRDIRNEIYDAGLVNDNDEFVNGKDIYKQLKILYPKVFDKSLQKGKVRKKEQDQKQRIAMRAGKYDELKILWERLNQKVILNYNIADEEAFLELLVKYLKSDLKAFKKSEIRTRKIAMQAQGKNVLMTKQESIEDIVFEPITLMSYQDFLLKLSKTAFIQRHTLHRAFSAIADMVDITQFLNQKTINGIAAKFQRWLLLNSFTHFEVSYQRMSAQVHPTKFTDKNGMPLSDINANDLGQHQDKQYQALPQFLFEQVFYDSEIERENIIKGDIKEVTVFTKIPKNSIKIPVAGGSTYSPDFAYVIKTSQGEILNLVIESKGVKDISYLRCEEKQKIKHAEALFNTFSQDIKVVFKTQFSDEKVANIIRQCLEENDDQVEKTI